MRAKMVKDVCFGNPGDTRTLPAGALVVLVEADNLPYAHGKYWAAPLLEGNGSGWPVETVKWQQDVGCLVEEGDFVRIGSKAYVGNFVVAGDIDGLVKDMEVPGAKLQLFTSPEDIQWALEVHAGKPELHRIAQAVLFVSVNEDAPLQIWVSKVKEVMLDTEVELVWAAE